MDAIEYPSLAPGVAQSGMASEAWRAPSGASHSSNTAGTTTRGVGQPDESSSEAAAFRDAAPALREDLAVDFEEVFFAPAAGAVPVARTPPDSATAEAYVSASIGVAVAASSAFFALLPMRGTTSLPPMCSCIMRSVSRSTSCSGPTLLNGTTAAATMHAIRMPEAAACEERGGGRWEGGRAIEEGGVM